LASSVPWIVLVHGQANCGNLQFLINFPPFYLQRYVEAQCCMASNDYKGEILYFMWNHLIIDCMLVLDAWTEECRKLCFMCIAMVPISVLKMYKMINSTVNYLSGSLQ